MIIISIVVLNISITVISKTIILYIQFFLFLLLLVLNFRYIASSLFFLLIWKQFLYLYSVRKPRYIFANITINWFFLFTICIVVKLISIIYMNKEIYLYCDSNRKSRFSGSFLSNLIEIIIIEYSGIIIYLLANNGRWIGLAVYYIIVISIYRLL